MGTLERSVDRQQVVLSSENLVGRLGTSKLRLELSFVSATHALIRWTGNHWGLRDLGSTNGTYIDGRRIAVGENIELVSGALIAFGDANEMWRLVDDTAPTPTAIPLGGGTPSTFANGYIGLPSSGRPLATLHMEGDSWLLETEEGRVQVSPGLPFKALGAEWRLECPSGHLGTIDASSQAIGLDDTTLTFTVSRDEEHVRLTASTGTKVRQLGERTCYYLGLVLARQRARDADAGVLEPGWLDCGELLRMIPDYASYAHLNVDIFRLREALGEAGIRDAPRVVETRRGQRRLGTVRFKLERGS